MVRRGQLHLGQLPRAVVIRRQQFCVGYADRHRGGVALRLLRRHRCRRLRVGHAVAAHAVDPGQYRALLGQRLLQRLRRAIGIFPALLVPQQLLRLAHQRTQIAVCVVHRVLDRLLDTGAVPVVIY